MSVAIRTNLPTITLPLFLMLLAGCIPGGGEPEFAAPPAPQALDYERQRADGAVDAPPTAPPAWQARPVVPDAVEIEAGSYTVIAGDTLRGIGERTGAGSEAIAAANGLAAPFVIHPGQTLAIPGGRYHLVRAGHTGIAIARAYGTDWSRIVTANALTEPYTLRVGMRLLIPGAQSGRSAAAERAAAFKLDIDDLITGGEPALAGNQRPAPPTRSPSRVLPSTAAIAAPAALRGAFSWPVRGPIVTRFGPGRSGERSNGIKIAVPADTPILAAADGVVAYAGKEIASLGGLVILKNGNGWTTVYGHASKLLVQRGQAVKRGEAIALSGSSGQADRPEVHFEMRKGRTPVDPLGQLPAL